MPSLVLASLVAAFLGGDVQLARFSIACMPSLAQRRSTRRTPPVSPLRKGGIKDQTPPTSPLASFEVALFDSPRSDRRAVFLGM